MGEGARRGRESPLMVAERRGLRPGDSSAGRGGVLARGGEGGAWVAGVGGGLLRFVT